MTSIDIAPNVTDAKIPDKRFSDLARCCVLFKAVSKTLTTSILKRALDNARFLALSRAQAATSCYE